MFDDVSVKELLLLDDDDDDDVYLTYFVCFLTQIWSHHWINNHRTTDWRSTNDKNYISNCVESQFSVFFFAFIRIDISTECRLFFDALLSADGSVFLLFLAETIICHEVCFILLEEHNVNCLSFFVRSSSSLFALFSSLLFSFFLHRALSFFFLCIFVFLIARGPRQLDDDIDI